MYDIQTRARNFCEFCEAFIPLPEGSVSSILYARAAIPGGTGTTSHTRSRPLSRVITREIGYIPGIRHSVKYRGAGTGTGTTFIYPPGTSVSF